MEESEGVWVFGKESPKIATTYIVPCFSSSQYPHESSDQDWQTLCFQNPEDIVTSR